MDNHFHTNLPEISDSFLKDGKRVSAPDKLGALFMDCLKTKLYPYGLIRFRRAKSVRISSSRQSGLVAMERILTSGQEIASVKIFSR